MPQMRARDPWKNNNILVQHAAEQLRHGRLALVLGAGASMGFGLPDWATLINRCYRQKKKRRKASMDDEAAAEYFFDKILLKKKKELRKNVGEALYRDFKFDAAGLSQIPLLNAIGAIAMKSMRGNTRTIVTFNFDDILETYLKYYGYSANSVEVLPTLESGADITLLHPHGYIPHQSPLAGTSELLLTQESFDRRVGKESEHWNRRILEVFDSHFCLFIGLSGKDKNLSSLLTNAKNPSKDLYWGIRFTDSLKDPANSLWENRGVFVKCLKSYGQLPEWLFQVCQVAAASS